MIRQYSDDECKRICELTHQYFHWTLYRIASNHAEAEAILASYKAPGKIIGALSLSEIYEHFLSHVQNTSTGGNAMRIVFGSPNIENQNHNERWLKLKTLLGNFDPHYVKSNFASRDGLWKAITKTYEQTTFTDPVERYITSIFEIGHFLGNFTDSKEVYDYFDKFYNQHPTSLIEHLLKSKGIHKRALSGLGEGLLRDALKEMGYVRFVKPDVHIADIAKRLYIADGKTSDKDVAEAVADIAERGGITPYHLDKFFFLIGSGSVYQVGYEQYGKKLQKADSVARKEDFALFVLERLSLPPISEGDKVALLFNYEDPKLNRGQVGIIEAVQKSHFADVRFAIEQDQTITKTLYPTEFVVLRGNLQ